MRGSVGGGVWRGFIWALWLGLVLFCATPLWAQMGPAGQGAAGPNGRAPEPEPVAAPTREEEPEEEPDAEPPAALTNPEGMEGREVAEVRVSGSRRVEPASIVAQLRTVVGKPLRGKTVSADIRRVWRMGYFSDIKVEAVESSGGKVVVIFEVEEKPAVAEIKVVGNQELSTDDITEVIDLKKFQILDVSKAKANAEKIRELYLEKGFYLAEVDMTLEDVPGASDQQIVVFTVREFAKVEVKQITFLGNSSIEDTELRQIMATREGDWFSMLTSFGNFKEEAFDADLQRIMAYYYDKGFVQVQVQVPTVRLSRDKRYLYITVKVDEGKQFNVGEVELQGDMIADRKKLDALVQIKTGETFSYGAMRRDAERLRDLYQDAGYAYANVNPLTRVEPETRQVNITYDIQKGSKVYFGRISVAGNIKTRDKVVRRELGIQEGQLYSTAALRVSQQRVMRLGFFEKAELTTQRTDRPDVIDVTVQVVERPTGTIQAGAGFSSAENILANVQLSQNNLFGRGQYLALQAQVSGIRRQFNLRFSEPYLMDTFWRFSASAYNFSFTLRDYSQESTGGNITMGYPLINNPGRSDDLSVSVAYKLEQVTITPGGTSGTNTQQVGSLFRGGLTSSVQLSLFYDARDNRYLPTKGHLHTARLELADDLLTLSQSEFLKTDIQAQYWHPLFWEFVLHLSGQLGYVTSIDRNKPIPLQERYLAGGPTTIRGFRRFTLGPSRQVASSNSDPGSSIADFKIGGNKQLLLTAEVTFPVLTALNLQGVFFADVGNAFDVGQGFTLVPDLLASAENNYNDALRTAVGAGFRWFSPIGLLRFEWGFPLERLRSEDPMVFEFSIGNQF
jgi:outer membrane protein insertion porin family